MLSVISSIVREASPSSLVDAPDFIPFLPFAFMVSVPLPHSVTSEPSLHFITAFSAFSFSGCSSSLLYSVSASVFSVPSAAVTVTSEDLPHASGAVSSEVSSSPSRISVTPVVPFFIFIEPSAHFPDTVYVPGVSTVSDVPSDSYPDAPDDTCIPVSENTNDPPPSPAAKTVHCCAENSAAAVNTARIRDPNNFFIMPSSFRLYFIRRKAGRFLLSAHLL